MRIRIVFKNRDEVSFMAPYNCGFDALCNEIFSKERYINNSVAIDTKEILFIANMS